MKTKQRRKHSFLISGGILRDLFFYYFCFCRYLNTCQNQWER